MPRAVPMELKKMSYTDPNCHYHISGSKKNYENVTTFLANNKNNPACKVRLPRCVVPCTITHAPPGLPSEPQKPSFITHPWRRVYRRATSISGSRPKFHRLCSQPHLRPPDSSYQLYYVRPASLVNVGRPDHANIMVLGHEDGDDGHEPHPFWYARVIGIFHADVKYCDGEPEKMDFLWVHWYGRDMTHRSGWRARRLPRIGLLEEGHPEAFGFLDPNDVLRASHLIPSFKFDYRGMVAMPMGLSISRPYKNWVYFYVDL